MLDVSDPPPGQHPIPIHLGDKYRQNHLDMLRGNHKFMDAVKVGVCLQTSRGSAEWSSPYTCPEPMLNENHMMMY